MIITTIDKEFIIEKVIKILKIVRIKILFS